MRIVSLLPSATEIVCALGHEADLIGRSAECDYPAEVSRLPVVMRARVEDAGGTSSEIDARVRAQRAGGESLYVLDGPLLATLRPDVLLTQDLCGVCSVTGEEVRAACRAARIDPEVVSLTPRSLEQVLDSVESVGAAIGAGPAAFDLAEELRGRQAGVVAQAPTPGRTATVLEWLDPPIAAGLWTPEMIRVAGAVPVRHPPSGEPGVRQSWERLRASAPDLLVLSPCSFPVRRTAAEVARAELGRSLREVGAARIYLADEAYFSRPGPRLWDGLELLSELLGDRPPRAPMPVVPWESELGGLAA